ncbi:hypothetical protein Poli38472_014140 [Pythium oligandrum]|uniref:Uncharacterized protein n=1 Tax=Pythium oligandrum TaxID=41045 RepID=A0A8K1CJE8_PYTOL|nr:hypothetical protein Poli38472_014140 [Pythium oligandrum]|eukprot:TMW64023.1 hypothetical protein Poli38472_014140 [Pythium oligandrum]
MALSAKRVVKKKTKSRTESLLAMTTQSAEGIARPVTRTEFQELVLAVAQLKKQSQRQIQVEAQVGSELELFGAQVSSNKNALGTLAEAVIEKSNELQQHVIAQLQQLQVESNKRLTDMQLALERLEFRFRHHLRDCQSLAERVEMQHDTLQHLKTQLGQTQLLLDQQQEHQKTFVETIQYTVKQSEEKMTTATIDTTKTIEAFQQRMISFVKGVESSVEESVAVIVAQTRDLEVQSKRQTSLLHQYLDDQLRLRQTFMDCETQCATLQQNHEEAQRKHAEDAVRLEGLEQKMGKLVLLIERRMDRSEIDSLLERTERNLKTRVEAVLELVQLCVHTLTKQG